MSGPQRQFASDTWAPMCPEAWAMLAQANADHAEPYGDDRWTARAADLVRETFACDADVYVALTGTAANSLALAALCQSYHSVICHEAAHIVTDECGAPEYASNGTKLLTVGGAAAKLDPTAVERAITRRSDIHYSKPRVVSLTQATEFGSVYTPAEIAAVAAVAKRHGLRVHMDGARFANAVATLGCHPADVTWRAGVDVLCFGGTKDGVGVGEMIVFFDRALAEEFAYRCKQAGHLLAKMRFVSAPWVGLLESGAWLRNATQANRMARLLAAELAARPGVAIRHPVEANAVFVDLPDGVAERLHALGWHFYNFLAGGGWRLMCSWDTTEADVRAFSADLDRALAC